MINNQFGSLQIKISMLKQSASLKIGENPSNIGYYFFSYIVLQKMCQFGFWSIVVLKFGRQSLSSRVIAILDLTGGSLTLLIKKC